MEIFNTACPRNCYSSCSFKIKIKKEKIINILPSKNNKSTPNGVCIKGLSYFERVCSPDRILFPQKKINGRFVKISWENALHEIACNLTSLKQTHGPQSVLFYSASGMSGLLNEISTNFWRLYGGATTVY